MADNDSRLDRSKSKFPAPDAAVLYFALYSIIGWCYEVFLEVVVYQWGFTNRGVLFGPYCPVYGVGALAFILLVYPLIKGRPVKERLIRIPLVFLLCLLIATSLELATSYILEAITGSWPWQTYVDYKINFQGRIALSPSVRFGLGGVLCEGGEIREFAMPWVRDPVSTHGTGCSLAAAIAAELALGRSISDAVAGAKRYVRAAIAGSRLVGPGCGVLGFVRQQ